MTNGPNVLLYVVCRTYKEAQTFASIKRVGPSKLRHINERIKLVGLSGIVLHVIPTARDLKEIKQIMDESSLRGFEIVSV